MKILPVEAELLHADVQTDRNYEANSRFSQFCERSWIWPSLGFGSRLLWRGWWTDFCKHWGISVPSKRFLISQCRLRVTELVWFCSTSALSTFWKPFLRLMAAPLFLVN